METIVRTKIECEPVSTIILRRKPCSVNLLHRWEIIQHFRDLVNIGQLLNIDLDEELVKFRKRLYEFGWDKYHIYDMEVIAYYKTIWEVYLPHIPRPAGDMFEWIRNRHRWKR